ncbi:MAG: hypothetical protein K0Q72_861, partial [Armatimonadetes bacterium]|nr:hypothetical protein [Armatimonadota bacterium]
MRQWHSAVMVLAVFLTAPALAASPPGKPGPAPRLAVTPASFRLTSLDTDQQVVVSESLADGRAVERTEVARYAVLDQRVARVSADGLVTPLGDGSTRLRVRLGSVVKDVPVTVDTRGAGAPSFTLDVHPLLSKAGCNSGTCHGKAEGQHGFRLSLFGFDPQFDYDTIVRASAGRRVARVDPARSLFLLKATSAIPHGGGARLSENSREYRTIARWIAAGSPYQRPSEPALTGIQVSPGEQSIGLKGAQRLLVTARYADGSTRDVTRETKYTSNNPAILAVDDAGLARSLAIPGAAAVMAAYQGQGAVSRILGPRDGAPLALPPASGYIDRLVWSRLSKLRIQPSEPASDSAFLRRASLDLVGALPTPEEARAFLADCDAERKKTSSTTGARARLVDRLLERPEYADLWALKWADLLRVNKDALGAKGSHAFYRWIREAVASNMSYDRFVREIVSASGSSAENGPVNLFRALSKPEEAASSLSQVFLGVRIECAQCHHHPFEKWSQDDYYGMVGFFSGLKTKADGPHSVLLTSGAGGEVKHPRTGLTVPPHPLEGDPAEFAGDGDRRQLLANWMASPTNRFVSRMLVNRVWAHF